MSGSDQGVRKHRFFIDVSVDNDVARIDDADLLKQWRTVLRLKVGSELILVGQGGIEAHGRILELGKTTAEVEILRRDENNREPKRDVTLYCALLKRENFEWVAQKATEVGVNRIVPVITDRTVKLNVKRERLAAIIKEAAEQSGRGKIPVLSEVMKFEDALRDSGASTHRMFFDVADAPGISVGSAGSVAAFIGPEGGWSDDERAAAHQSGAVIVSLGSLTLRGETAAVIATYLCVNA